MNKLYTLGYTGRKPEDIAVIAKGLGAVIVDIRMSPVSRVACWNGYALRSFLDIHGVRYEHVPDLGNVNYRSSQPITIQSMETGAMRLATLLEAAPCVILCACEHYDECHRQHVAEFMGAYYGTAFEHIGQSCDQECCDQMTLL